MSALLLLSRPGGGAGLARGRNDAARYLRKQGFRIIARNWSTPLGESISSPSMVIASSSSRSLDRRRDAERPPHRSTTEAKRLTRMALQYLQAKNLLGAMLASTFSPFWPAEREPTIEHFRSAFEPTDRFQMFS